MEKRSLINNMCLVATQQMFLLFYENVPDYIRKEYRSPNSYDLSLLDFAIWDIIKKILCKNLKRYEDIEGLSAAMSYVWDRLKKNHQ